MAVLACSGSAQAADPPIDGIAELLPGLEVTLTDRDSESTEGLHVIDFGYEASDHDWPYGTGFAVVDDASASVLWIYLHHGDYPVHSVYWADFDGDGAEDIFFNAGWEDAFGTYMYLNRVARRLGLLEEYLDGQPQACLDELPPTVEYLRRELGADDAGAGQ